MRVTKSSQQTQLEKIASEIQEISPKGRRRTRLPERMWDQILALAEQGLSLDVICEATGLKRTTVSRRVSKHKQSRVHTMWVTPEPDKTSQCEIHLRSGVVMKVPMEVFVNELWGRISGC